MAQYPIKMLKDEEKEPFVPLVAPEAVIDNNNENLVQKLAKKINEPIAEGTNGQVLATDGNGERFWTTVQGGSSDIRGQVFFYNGINESELVETDSNENHKTLQAQNIRIKDPAFSAWTISSDNKSLNIIDDKIKRIKVTYICHAVIGLNNPVAVIGIKINNSPMITALGGGTEIESYHNLCCEGIFDINAGDVINFLQKTRSGGKYYAYAYSIIIEALN